jgi:heat shock protein HslJ
MEVRCVRAAVGLAVIGAIVACANAASSDDRGDPLIGTHWQLQTLGTTAVLESGRPTLEFASGRVTGTGACNRFNGPVTVSGKSITFGALATTRMACGDDVNRQEAAYLKALAQAQWFLVQGATLTIYTSAMDMPLAFVRLESN